jgi:hypothetical protein
MSQTGQSLPKELPAYCPVRGDSYSAIYRIQHGWPRDAFAKGTVGQYVIVIPSERLAAGGDGVFQLVCDVVAACFGPRSRDRCPLSPLLDRSVSPCSLEPHGF